MLFKRPLMGSLVFPSPNEDRSCALVVSGSKDFDDDVKSAYHEMEEYGWRMFILHACILEKHAHEAPFISLTSLLEVLGKQRPAAAADPLASLVVQLNLQSDAEGGGDLLPLREATAKGALCATRALTLEWNRGIVCDECGDLYCLNHVFELTQSMRRANEVTDPCTVSMLFVDSRSGSYGTTCKQIKRTCAENRPSSRALPRPEPMVQLPALPAVATASAVVVSSPQVPPAPAATGGFIDDAATSGAASDQQSATAHALELERKEIMALEAHLASHKRKAALLETAQRMEKAAGTAGAAGAAAPLSPPPETTKATTVALEAKTAMSSPPPAPPAQSSSNTKESAAAAAKSTWTADWQDMKALFGDGRL